jgi:hypothetical protein
LVDLGVAVVADKQRLNWWSQAKVRSTTQRYAGRPTSSKEEDVPARGIQHVDLAVGDVFVWGWELLRHATRCRPSPQKATRAV